VIFLLVLIIGVVVSTAFRVVLREDVLKRLPLRHGVPFAVSTITYYVMLFFVFMLALVAAGVQLSKFTLFTGAFGIGVGFGLQNTINNFASGIVLLLERPIRENDILEVDGTFGEVTRIGMRSTSIRTSEEAEVIVPNSSLVAGKVINWSRLGRRRSVEIPIKVAYGTNPQDVIDLLEKTASTHPEVLHDPSPSAFLQRFGDRALEFVLVFWVGRYHLHRKVLSEVAIKITESFTEADIQIHLPEQAANATPDFSELQRARN
jgi:small-conductance mechanosensitive channel